MTLQPTNVPHSYDGEADEPVITTTKFEPDPVKAEPQSDSAYPEPTATKQEDDGIDFNIKTEANEGHNPYAGDMQGMQGMDAGHNNGGYGGGGHTHDEDNERPIYIKDDG